MLNYFLGYGAFLLGSLLYLLGKVQDYRDTAKANPDPKVKYSTKDFFNNEWVNIARLLVAGIGLVIILPMIIPGANVQVVNSEGAKIGSMPMKATLIPMYFLLAYSGNSAIFAFFGKYKKTLVGSE